MHDDLKTVVITGGAKGIGAAIAGAFYKAGYAVVICGRHENGLAKKLGRGVFFVKADVGRRRDLQKLMAAAVQKTGRLDALINCAGFSQWKRLEAIDEKFLDEILNVNLKGVFFSCQAALRYLGRGGVIVNVASVAGKRGSANNSAYCASKFGVIGLTQALAKELGQRGIRANAVCPVYIITDGIRKALAEKDSPAAGQPIDQYLKNFALTQSALQRLPTAGEVAQACLFLASDQASAVTGQSLNIDCGVLPQ